MRAHMTRGRRSAAEQAAQARLLTLGEAAALLTVSPDTVARMADAGGRGVVRVKQGHRAWYRVDPTTVAMLAAESPASSPSTTDIGQAVLAMEQFVRSLATVHQEQHEEWRLTMERLTARNALLEARNAELTDRLLAQGGQPPLSPRRAQPAATAAAGSRTLRSRK